MCIIYVSSLLGTLNEKYISILCHIMSELTYLTPTAIMLKIRILADFEVNHTRLPI
jgi:hypothetical protein